MNGKVVRLRPKPDSDCTTAELLDELAAVARKVNPKRLAAHLAGELPAHPHDRRRHMARRYRPQAWELQTLKLYAEGATATKIAEELGKNLGTLKSSLQRAKAAGVLTGSHKETAGPVVDWDRLRELQDGAPVNPGSQPVSAPVSERSPQDTAPVKRATQQATGGPFTAEEVAALKALAARELGASKAALASGPTEVVRIRLASALVAALRERAHGAKIPLSDALAAAVALYLDGPG